MSKQLKHFALMCILVCLGNLLAAQIITVGSSSYTKTFPGTDEAGRNGFPGSAPLVSGAAATKPIPTNDWWSSLLKNDIFGGSNDFAENLFNYPISMQTTSKGLMVSYIPFGVIDDQDPIIVGVQGLNATKSTVSDFSDWTVTMDWSERFQATSGVGMPFLYFTKAEAEVAAVTINLGTVSVDGEMITVTDARNGADFAIYAPAGSTWTKNGNIYTSSLNGKNYWSLAMLPQENASVASAAEAYKQYAYVFPTDTRVDWAYDEGTSVMRSTFVVETAIKEGTNTEMLLGLLPHQWDHLAADSPQPDGEEYQSVRGEMKTLTGNSFIVEHTFHGILPTLPYLANYSEGFNLSALDEKVKLLENDQLATWTDSYNEGQVMNRLIQTARIAHEMGNYVSRDKMLATIKSRLEDWLTVEGGEVAFLFYYHSEWSAMLGYPGGHGQDTNINDHHFHWGYFIHAAAFLEQFEPGWAAQWGGMIDLLIRDAASPDRNDELFPFLRNFSPYAGHSWANGMAAFPQGNDQESTSESMQFNSALIHWGSITGNDEIRDLGIYLYTTEQSAIEEYWFDTKERIFPDNPYSLVSRVWGNAYDNGTFWTNDIEASYGIELYPIHGGSMYLGHNTAYAEKLWAEIEGNTGILSNDDNVNLWHDVMWKYLSFTDPEKAITLYNSYPDRSLKFGVSDAQTYYWLHSMNAMGKVDASITADYPVAVAFVKDGAYTYAAHNYTDQELSVTFSDGYVLTVPPNSMGTNRDVTISGELVSSFGSAYPGGSVALTVTADGGDPSKVEFFDNGVLIGEDTEAPFSFKATELAAQVHGFYAKIYEGEAFGVSNIVSVVVGEQRPYEGINALPGEIQAGLYDVYEGGNGQGIAYSDVSANNEGNFRLDEGVDVLKTDAEGATIGWIAGGEWVEYSIEVDSSGLYEMSFRFASGNQSGGGPFHLELNGERISDDVSLAYTGDWDDWETKVITHLAIHKGSHVLRLTFDHGEFNIGRMTFSYQEELPYSHPIADAGGNVSVISPETTATLDGSASFDAENDPLTFAWEQVYGPSVIHFSTPNSAVTDISNLENGIYKCRLMVSDGAYSSQDELLVIVSETGNAAPSVSITSPNDGASFKEGSLIEITASASDLEEDIEKVEFYVGETKLGEDTTAPYKLDWTEATVGSHALKAIVYDGGGLSATSAIVEISVEEVKTCSESSSDAVEGSFSIGYEVTFESVGTNVSVTFELLDTDKSGVVAFLREESPFSEVQMDHVSGTTFTKTLTGRSVGSTISVACKFAFAGGLAVTKYFQYQVGSDCSGTADTTPPENFTATIGEITFNSIELILNGSDDSGKVVYEAAYGSKLKALSVDGGSEGRLVLNGLQEETSYSISVHAADLSGNQTDPIVLTASTTVNTNTDCSGTDFQAQQGEFVIGYTYAFETIGNDLKIIFELLEEKPDVFAFLWEETPFTETKMTQVSGQKFTVTLPNVTLGESGRYACKFEFAGGLAVTRYHSYVAGDDCEEDQVLNTPFTSNKLTIYPNPVQDLLHINWEQFSSVAIYSIEGKLLLTSSQQNIPFSAMESGIYLLRLTGLNGETKSVWVLKD